MRTKIVIGVLTTAVAVLLATHPVVVDAAAQISGKDVKNNSLTGKDVKNGSLKKADFKAGQLPAGPAGPAGPPGPSGAVHVINGGTATMPVTVGFPVFFGDTTTVTLDRSGSVLASATFNANSSGTTVAQIAWCAQALGGPTFLMSGRPHALPLTSAGQLYTVSDVSTVLDADDYTVGLCLTGNSLQVFLSSVTGSVQVVGPSRL